MIITNIKQNQTFRVMTVDFSFSCDSVMSTFTDSQENQELGQFVPVRSAWLLSHSPAGELPAHLGRVEGQQNLTPTAQAGKQL